MVLARSALGWGVPNPAGLRFSDDGASFQRVTAGDGQAGQLIGDNGMIINGGGVRDRVFSSDNSLVGMLRNDSTVRIWRIDPPMLVDQQGMALATASLGYIAIQQGQLEQATLLLDESRQLSEQLGDTENLAVTLSDQGLLAFERHHNQQAALLQAQSIELLQHIGSFGRIAPCLVRLAAVALRQQLADIALRLLSVAEQICLRLGTRLTAGERAFAARTATRAQTLLGQSSPDQSSGMPGLDEQAAAAFALQYAYRLAGIAR